MATARITSKGQITIPKEVRDALDLTERDQVMFVVEGKRVVMVPVPSRGVMSLRGCLPATRPYPGEDAIWEEVGHSLARGEV